VKKIPSITWLIGSIAGLVAALAVSPVLAHHSFAMYDLTKTETKTGVLVRYIPGSNHAQLIFDVLDSSGKPVLESGKPARWGVEMSSAVQLARQGVTAKTFPTGTVFTVALHPLRDGRPFGAIAGLLISCGTALPTGGCTKDTGKTHISGGGPD
jgi:hypothetical protein